MTFLRALPATFVALTAAMVTNVAMANTGFVQQRDGRFDVIDSKSIWSASRNKVVVYLLPCRFDQTLLDNWTVRERFLRCAPIHSPDYYGAPGAKMTFELNDRGQLVKLTFESIGIGSDPTLGYRTTRHTWRSDFPVSDLWVDDQDNLQFEGYFALSNASLTVVVKPREAEE